MDLVVIFLPNVGEHIIVPETYVYNLDMKQLKNRGRNSCRDYLVYWSDDSIECEYYPEPIPNASNMDKFPAGQGGYFKGRLILFTSKFFYIFYHQEIHFFTK